MERRQSLLFGIFGGVFLALLYGPLSMGLGNMRGFFTEILIQFLSIVGFITITYFSILLIIDTIKTVHKK
ncbi:MAG: hypothetical protein ACM3X7_00420 [Solirubrobacterales bacterium]